MNGKQKCEKLRSIRMTIAQKYGIEYEPKECDHEECATGTCPMCEQEADFILGELLKRGETGELNKDDLKFFNDLNTLFDEPTDEEDEDLLPMGIPAPFEDDHCIGEIDDEPVTLMGNIAAPDDDDDQDEDSQEDDEHPFPRP